MHRAPRRVGPPQDGVPGAPVGQTGPSKQPLFIEVCCGSARLASEVSKCGLGSLGIDHVGNRHSPQADVLILDLASEHGTRALVELCEDQ